MFCGTLRDNLDPSRRSDDAAIWQALEAAMLSDHVSSLEGKLDAEVRHVSIPAITRARGSFLLATVVWAASAVPLSRDVLIPLRVCACLIGRSRDKRGDRDASGVALSEGF